MASMVDTGLLNNSAIAGMYQNIQQNNLNNDNRNREMLISSVSNIGGLMKERNKQIEDENFADLIRKNTDENGVLNEKNLLTEVANTTPSKFLEVRSFLDAQNLNKLKLETEADKNRNLALKAKEEAITEVYNQQTKSYENKKKGYEIVLNMIKNSNSNDDKNRAIQEADKFGIDISSYYRNNEFTEDMKEKAMNDLLTGKEKLDMDFEEQKQAYAEGQDLIKNTVAAIGIRQKERELSNSEEATRQKTLSDSRAALKASKDDLFKDNLSVNEFVNKNTKNINDLRSDFDTKESEARKGISLAQGYLNNINSFNERLRKYMSDNNKSESDSFGIVSNFISENINNNSEQAVILRNLSQMANTIFMGGVEQMRGLGALTDYEGQKIEQVRGSTSKLATFGELLRTSEEAAKIFEFSKKSLAKKAMDAKKTMDAAIKDYTIANDNVKNSFNNKYSSNNNSSMNINNLNNQSVDSNSQNVNIEETKGVMPNVNINQIN